MTSRETAWNAIAQEPYYVAGLRLRPLNFGAVYLIAEIGGESPRNLKEMIIAISIANAVKHSKACEIWALWIEKPIFMYWRWMRIIRRVKGNLSIVRKTWRGFWKHSTDIPEMSGGHAQSFGQDVLYTIRASLVVNGGYTHDEAMNSPFQRVLLDFAFQNGIDVWDEKKQAGLEALKGDAK